MSSKTSTTDAASPIPLGPVPATGQIPGLNTAADADRWVTTALRGVDVEPVERAYVNAMFQQPGGEVAAGVWAILVERSRQAERQATIEELAGGHDAIDVLIAQARTDERQLVEQESAELLVKVENQRRAERAQRVAANREAWATITSSLGLTED